MITSVFRFFVFIFFLLPNYVAAKELCDDQSKNWLATACEIQNNTQQCQSIAERFSDRGLDLQSGNCREDESHLTATVVCGSFTLSLGAEIVARYQPQSLVQGAQKLTERFSGLKSIGKIGFTTLRAAGGVLTGVWLADLTYNALKDSSNCFQNFELKKASMSMADATAKKLLSEVGPYVESSTLKRLQFPQIYLQDKFIKNASCEELNRIMLVQKKKQDAVLGPLLAQKKLTEDPRKKIHLTPEEEQDVRLLSDSMPCLSPAKQAEALCAIGNIVTGGASLTNSLARYKRQVGLSHVHFQKNAREDFRRRYSGDDEEDAAKLLAYEKQLLAREHGLSGGKLRAPQATQRPKAAENFIKENHDKVFASPEQNRRFIEKASLLSADGKTQFLHVDNSKMKWLNDSTNDRPLVTALTNRHKEVLINKIKDLEKEFPDLEVSFYSDFKSTRFAFSGNLPKNLNEKIDEIFIQSNKAYSEEMLAAGLMPKGETGLDWFRGGVGDTADRANLSSRMARSFEGDNRLGRYNEAEIQNSLSRQIPYIEKNRSAVVSDLRSIEKKLGYSLTEARDGHVIPSKEIFELVRKNPSHDKLESAFRGKYGHELSPWQSERIINYAGMVDQFSLDPLIPERQIVSFNQAVKSGMSLDFAGMGALNMQATAAALAKSKNLDEAVVGVRLGERKVTVEFNQAKETTRKEILTFLGKRKGISDVDVKCSGDDCIAIMSESLDIRSKEALIHKMSATESPASRRIAFVSGKIRDGPSQNVMAAHGETLEKYLRQEVAGKLSADKSRKLLFAIDMQGEQVGQGPARLIIGNSRVKLDEGDRKVIKEAYQKALEKLSHESKSRGISIDYQSSFSERF